MTIRMLDESSVTPLLPGMAADDLDVITGLGTWVGYLLEERLAGVVHLIPFAGDMVLDDVWTEPEFRTRGIATTLIAAAGHMHPALWLICDEPEIGFYERRGFRVVENLPDAITAHYVSKNEWPEAPDHPHFAMTRG